MKKVSLFLISATLLWAMIKLLETKDNHQIFTQREREIPSQFAAGFDDNEIPSFLRASGKQIQ